jgi:hypothetical protein
MRTQVLQVLAQGNSVFAQVKAAAAQVSNHNQNKSSQRDLPVSIGMT